MNIIELGKVESGVDVSLKLQLYGHSTIVLAIEKFVTLSALKERGVPVHTSELAVIAVPPVFAAAVTITVIVDL